jgi:HEAT repeat protein
VTSRYSAKVRRPRKLHLCPFLRPLSVRIGSEPSLRDIERYGIKSLSTLRNKLDDLPLRQLGTAIWVLGKVGNRNDVPKLLKIRQTQPALVHEVLEALSNLGGKRSFNELVRSLQNRALSLEVRVEACHGLGHRWSGNVPASIFYPIVSSPDEDPNLRGHAAEAIGIRVPRRSKSEMRKAVTVLLPCLGDHSAEVRFWAVFALAGLDARVALPKLRRLVRQDHENGPLGWTVSEEAKDAIYYLTKGCWPEIDAYARKEKSAGRG